MASTKGQHLPLFLLLLLSISLITSAKGEWVDYYPSDVIGDILAEDCDPFSSDANSACRDVCHYSGCKHGGQCRRTAPPNSKRFCHCDC